MTWNTTLTVCGLAGLLAACGSDAEPTKFRVQIENITVGGSLLSSGAAAIPNGESEPGPIFPGQVFETTFHAGPGASLSFAAMMVQSNDWFYAPMPTGIALFDDEGSPLEGDITDHVRLWDAGTEADETPGEGVYQAPRQTGPNMGPADSNTMIREVSTVGLPDIDDVLAVSLTWAAGNEFTLRVSNVSTMGTLTIDGGSVGVPVAPVALVVHSGGEPLFSVGSAASAGLQILAEDGDPGAFVAELSEMTQVATPFAPGVWALQASAGALFDANAPRRDNGLEMLAEDGDPSVLATSLETEGLVSGVFNTPTGAAGPGPATPGGSYEFEFEAEDGDALHFATMIVQSNDWFVSPAADGIALFDSSGMPTSGDITTQLAIWDAGSEVDESPGAGPNQPLRQSGPNTGADENGNVRIVTPSGPVPTVAQTVRVTINPLP